MLTGKVAASEFRHASAAFARIPRTVKEDRSASAERDKGDVCLQVLQEESPVSRPQDGFAGIPESRLEVRRLRREVCYRFNR